MDAQSRIRSCIGCARQKFQNFAIFGAKHLLEPLAFKHFTPNFERARTYTFVHVHILDVWTHFIYKEFYSILFAVYVMFSTTPEVCNGRTDAITSQSELRNKVILASDYES